MNNEKEVEIEYVILDDNNKYIILGSQIINNITYYYLVNSNDKNDFVIRKKIDDELVGLDDDIEFNLVINTLKELIENNAI